MKIIKILAAIVVCLSLIVGCAADPTTTATTATSATTTTSAGTGATSTTKSAVSPEVIKIGVLLPMSGATATKGKNSWQAVQSYLDYHNKNGGFSNRPNLNVEFVLVDTEGSADVAVAAFERLANQDIKAFIGPYNSGVAVALAPLCIKYEVPISITFAISDLSMAVANDYVFRPTVGDTDLLETHKQMFTYMAKQSGKEFKTAAIVYGANDYGLAASKNYRDIFKSMGVQILVDESVQGGATDLSGAVNKVKSANPDCVVVLTYQPESMIFQKAMKEYNCNVPVVAGNGYVDPSFVDGVGVGTGDYVVGAAQWYRDTVSYADPKAKEIMLASEQKYGIEWKEDQASTWMSTAVLFDAINRAEKIDRKSIAKAMKNSKLKKDHIACVFHGFEVEFADNYLGRYNQNPHAVAVYAQLFGREWKPVYSPVFEIKDSPLVWPPIPFNKR